MAPPRRKVKTAPARRPRAQPKPTPVEFPELFIGLVAATGTNTDEVAEKVTATLSEFGYDVHEVKLSGLLSDFFPNLPDSPRDKYIRSRQEAGNKLREKLGRADGLALAAIAEIRAIREEKSGLRGNEQLPLARTAFLLRSLKRPEEVERLRELYGDRFILISAYSPRDTRVDSLARDIADSSRSRKDETLARSKAEEIIAVDEAEEANEFGQNVRNAFPLADFFVDARTPERLEETISRCFDVFFGDPFRTPRPDEAGMFHAQAAAVRSAELGRQVGAAIATPDGAIVAVGTNDVAKRGGGLYWEGDEHDDRDFRHGEDTNEIRRTRVVDELLTRMKEAGWLRRDKQNETVETLLRVFDDTRLASLIEFGRAVHAEMAALTDAAMRGVSVKGCTLYTTTFPCHLCARHVVAAGIERLVYIHPYPKSLAAQLYEDSIAVDQEHVPDHVIEFQPFVGVAPSRYLDLFTAQERKAKGGKAVTFVRAEARPKFTFRRFSEMAYLLREQLEASTFNELLKASGLKPGSRASTTRRRSRVSARTTTSTTTRKTQAARKSRSTTGRRKTR